MGTYSCNGEKYLVVANFDNAKRFSSFKRAKNSAESYREKYDNASSNYEIIEIEE